jgi:hypothetical protein
MAGTGTKIMVFLIVLHTVFYFAGAEGMIEHQEGPENQHKQFVEQFDENTTKTVDTTETDASVFDQIRLSAEALPFIGFIVQIFSAPYTFLGSTNLPEVFIMLFQAILGFAETVAIASFIRGYDF